MPRPCVWFLCSTTDMPTFAFFYPCSNKNADHNFVKISSFCCCCSTWTAIVHHNQFPFMFIMVSCPLSIQLVSMPAATSLSLRAQCSAYQITILQFQEFVLAFVLLYIVIICHNTFSIHRCLQPASISVYIYLKRRPCVNQPQWSTWRLLLQISQLVFDVQLKAWSVIYLKLSETRIVDHMSCRMLMISGRRQYKRAKIFGSGFRRVRERIQISIVPDSRKAIIRYTPHKTRQQNA